MILHEDLKNDLLAKNCGNKFGTEFLKTFAEGGWEVLPKMKSPRFIKTHLPLSLLPKDTFAKRCKVGFGRYEIQPKKMRLILYLEN